MIVGQVMRPILLEKKKWKPEIKDSWMTFFSSIVKVFLLSVYLCLCISVSLYGLSLCL